MFVKYVHRFLPRNWYIMQRMHAGFLNDTIAAIATAEGPAGVAVVRISGEQAWEVAARVVQHAGARLLSRGP